jgi:spore coat assembly protein
MIATTSVTEYVDIRKVISMTSNKEKGMGGIETKGVARKIY